MENNETNLLKDRTINTGLLSRTQEPSTSNIALSALKSQMWPSDKSPRQLKTCCFTKRDLSGTSRRRLKTNCFTALDVKAS